MNLQRLAEILDAYGGDPQRWPDDERAAALVLCSDNAEAKNLLNAALSMDKILDSFQPEPHQSEELIRSIEAHIEPKLHRSTTGVLDQFIHWLVPESASTQSFFRPALVACLPILLGIWIGSGETVTDELTLDEEYAVLAVFTPTDSEGS